LDPELADVSAQIDAQEFKPAIIILEQRIRSIETTTHRYDESLVVPLTLLGDAQAGDGDYDGALDSYGRAVHVNRVNDGLISPKQVDIVYREAEVYRLMGNYQETNNREEYAYHVLNKAYGAFDEKLLPGVYHLANWYKESYNIYQARLLYQRALQILDFNDRRETHEAIPALSGVAATYRLERFPPFLISNLSDKSYISSGSDDPISINNFPAGERALQNIVSILRANPDEDPVLVAEAVLELADWYLLWDRTDRAFPLYEHAYTLLADAENVDVEGYFSEPKLLYYPFPRDPRAPPVRLRGEKQIGFVEIGYEIGANGRVRSLKTVASEPKGLMDFRVRKSIRFARYRPVVMAGTPTNVEEYVYRHEFNYFPRRPNTAPGSPSATPVIQVSDE
ncbi:MAG: hypothetical protein O7F71_19525, partial [Gammaproteobacteria bacterium]|nr:hypothetical protein [Gammaproteobacteria bacterium]